MTTFLHPSSQLLPRGPFQFQRTPGATPFVWCPHLLPTPSQRIPSCFSFVFYTVCVRVSDSSNDLDQQGNHRHHHPKFPLGRENCRKAFGSAVSLTLLFRVVCQGRTAPTYRRNIRPTRDQCLPLTLETRKSNFPSRRLAQL